MKQYLFPLLLAAGLGAGPQAWAEKADSTKPTNIEANQMAYDDVKQINTFTGNVVLTRGTLSMKAGKLIVRQDPAGYQYATLIAPAGGLATFRQKRDAGPNQWVEGEAERIEYDGKNEVVKLFTRAKLRRLEGSKPMDEVEGELITYDSRAEYFTVNNSATGDGRGGRIRAVIQPRNDGKGG